MFKSAADCGRLHGYKDGIGAAWSVSVGVYNRSGTRPQYNPYEGAVVWPGSTNKVLSSAPLDSPLDWSKKGFWVGIFGPQKHDIEK